MDEILINLPPSADEDDPIDSGLVELTEAISRVDPTLLSHGALGGRFGYGAKYENDVFMMHPFCWCERSDCPWCVGCSCEMEPAPSWEVAKQCDNCKNPKEQAPNFHHKPSGMKVRWYKWIGRGMEVEGRPDNVSALFRECIASVTGSGRSTRNR